MDYIKRLKNDLNKFIFTEACNKASTKELDILIKAGDIIDKYRG